MGTGPSTPEAPKNDLPVPKKYNSESSTMSTSAVEYVQAQVGKMQLSVRYHKNGLLQDDYEVSETVLGTGLNGVVRMGSSKFNKRQKVAVKPFKLIGLDKNSRRELESEIMVFLCMDHPHVTTLFDVYETKDTIQLVMECMEGGELFDRITELKTFSEHHAADAIWQMLLAVNYIHNHKVVHADIKLENFLYDKKDSEHLKLIDFGFSKRLNASEKLRACVGTLSYIAPEVLRDSYTTQCDVWGLGVISFILLLGYMPFSGSEKLQKEKILKGQYKVRQDRWDKASANALEFVKALLQVDPDKRLTAQGALDHTWIANRKTRNSKTEVTSDVAEALCQFGRASKFRKCCMQTMAWSLSNEDRAKVREYFISMDTSQQGTITLAELKDVMVNKFNISSQDTKHVFDALDSNNDELIHYSDFLAAMVNTRIDLHDDLLRQAFQKFDVDNSGFITAENMREVLGADNGDEDDDCDDILRSPSCVKIGGGEKLSFEEFVAYVKNSPQEAETMIDGMRKENVVRETSQSKGMEDILGLVRKSSVDGKEQRKERAKNALPLPHQGEQGNGIEIGIGEASKSSGKEETTKENAGGGSAKSQPKCCTLL